jgi:isochorismate hydrolase
VKFKWYVDSKRVLAMVYDTQNYWVSGLCPSSGILNIIKHNILETGSVSVLRCGQGDTYSAGPLRKS